MFQFKGILVKSISLFIELEEIKIAAGAPITIDLDEGIAEWDGHCFEADLDDYQLVN